MTPYVVYFALGLLLGDGIGNMLNERYFMGLLNIVFAVASMILLYNIV